MSVWTKIQSWINAVADGTDLDNEFNNIYLGLNEAANGSLPNGYNDIRLTFSADQLTVKGVSKINSLNVDINSTITVSGASGWRYVVSTDGGVVSVETIPGAEITADTQVHTPNPVFNNSKNGYYSTVNTTRRIIAILYYDAVTKILEAINYGNGSKKNDDIWETNDAGVLGTAANTRLQFTGTWTKKPGQNIVCVDNGAPVSYDDTEGFRVTFLKNGNAKIGVVLTMSSGSISMRKNAALFKTNILYAPALDVAIYTIINTVVNRDDYFTFVNDINSLGVTISSMTIEFEEF